MRRPLLQLLRQLRKLEAANQDAEEEIERLRAEVTRLRGASGSCAECERRERENERLRERMAQCAYCCEPETAE